MKECLTAWLSYMQINKNNYVVFGSVRVNVSNGKVYLCCVSRTVQHACILLFLCDLGCQRKGA